MLHRAVVLVTHDISEAFALADRVAVLHDGQIVAFDVPRTRFAPHPTRGWRHCVGRTNDERVDRLHRVASRRIRGAAGRARRAGAGLHGDRGGDRDSARHPCGAAARRLRSRSSALANLAQTIPSLALFGFLIPLPFLGGIGTRTALVALTVYAVLPVLRGTITGITACRRR